jgi:transcriptional regulator with XRE-family HTH domain
MGTLHERLSSLCEERGIKGGRMCVDLGISKSLMTDLKSGRKKGVNAETAQKIATYFNVSVGYLLGEEEKIKADPVGTAERHFEMIMDEDLSEIFEDFKNFDETKRKIVKNLVKSLAET